MAWAWSVKRLLCEREDLGSNPQRPRDLDSGMTGTAATSSPARPSQSAAPRISKVLQRNSVSKNKVWEGGIEENIQHALWHSHTHRHTHITHTHTYTQAHTHYHHHSCIWKAGYHNRKVWPSLQPHPRNHGQAALPWGRKKSRVSVYRWRVH